jgi:glycosyltransferase involved in cell wall biosynthesis
MRIVFVIGSLGRAGAERQMMMLASGLQNRGHIVSIVCLDGTGGFDEEARQRGLKVLILEKRFPKLIRSATTYMRHVRDVKPHVVYAFLPKQHIVATLLKPLSRQSKIVWGIRASQIDWKSYRLRARVFFPIATKLSRWADMYIANSWAGAEYHISEGYESKKMRVIPNGIDAAVFHPDDKIRSNIRIKWKAGEEVPVIGILSRFDPMKGNDHFLEVASKVVKQLPSAMFIAVGRHTDEQAEAYFERASLLGLQGKLQLFKTTEQPQHYLNGFDVLVVPSKSEGFPNTVLESLACGTPVVGTDVGDIKKILGPKYGSAKFGEIEVLTEGVLSLLGQNHDSEKRTQLSIDAFQNYSESAMVESTDNELMQLCRLSTR